MDLFYTHDVIGMYYIKTDNKIYSMEFTDVAIYIYDANYIEPDTKYISVKKFINIATNKKIFICSKIFDKWNYFLSKSLSNIEIIQVNNI